VSNAAISDLERIIRIAGSTLRARFAHVQNEYNLLATDDCERLIPFCAAHGLRYTAFSPLAGGLLTGKYRRGEPPPPGSRLAKAPEVCAAYVTDASFAVVEELRQSATVARQSMSEAALRFVLDTPGLDSLIIAPRRVEHFASLGFEDVS
jgi:aryl-alcohol dehydrogenase-like predicted oxidoreductase